MKSSEIRQEFLIFFEEKGHKIVPSAPMVIKDDPTLMFTNAGMNQFKDVFLGNSAINNKRVTDTQKCLRVSGKHNDLEEVGHDTYHHTMFEMLGNWSFGDYFKKEAIEWAWEFLVSKMGVPEDRLYATVFEGNDDDDLKKDDEAYKYWLKFLPEERILDGSKKDNFWEMGEQGPCGPCSEVHIDLRSDEERKLKPGSELVNKDHHLVIEIWNLVFMQYNRKADGSLESLPHKHVDTGMGFERLCMVLQGKISNYDTDLFQPIIKSISEKTGIAYGNAEETDIAMRVMADHIRTIAFAITDGQLPSNNKAGYVIRRILRRAVRYGYTFLGIKEAFMYKLISVLVDVMGEHFPELKSQKTLIEKVIKEEENAFLRTLENGIRLLDQIIVKTKEEDFKTIPGKVAFELYDTYGFPLDLTELILKEQGLVVNRREFKAEMEAQKSRSRIDASVDKGDWIELVADDTEEFVGYDSGETDVVITRYRKVSQKKKDYYHLVFNITPFYGESGGQVGDIGYIESAKEKIDIIDTKKENGLIIHIAQKLPKDITAPFIAHINNDKRRDTANNHTATHLLHYALRKVLGEHVEQKGSLVSPNHLRFDFSHFEKLTDEKIAQVEAMVNLMVRENITLEEKRAITMKEAQNIGAVALFGEKYGDLVRVIKFGESVELCGGTHVAATGQIGMFRIISESSISAGIRRIEAVTAGKAEDYVNNIIGTFKEVDALFNSKQGVVSSIEKLLSENAEMKKELNEFHKESLKIVKNSLKKSVREIRGVNFVSEIINASAADVKDILFQLKGEIDNLIAIIGGKFNGKPHVSIIIADNLVKEYDLNAGQLVRVVAREIQGGGGGQPFFATAGGKDITGIENAVAKAEVLITEKIS